MVYRVFVEKKSGLDNEAQSLKSDLSELLKIKNIERVRVLNRYDVEGIDKTLFERAVKNVLSEVQLDDVIYEMPDDFSAGGAVLAVEYLPGQFDMRANSASECIALISKGVKAEVKTAKVYIFYGNVSRDDFEKIKNYLINPVECREAFLEKPETLFVQYEKPHDVETLHGFTDLSDGELDEFMKKMSLAMDKEDLKLCRDYFKSENRCPTFSEIKVIDTYWSDHCRHTTFNTVLENVQCEDALVAEAFTRYKKLRESCGVKKPVTLMDIATIGAKVLKKKGHLKNLDESDEINACTVKIKANIDDKGEDYLLLFKNETHNHPTEIEPFGGAATCIGGAIRDPLSGRGYVYSAMRVTGAADPRTPLSETLKGKLPQRKIVTGAANGYSSYGNQIGLATGLVEEVYHPGFVAKRMEVGAVVACVPEKNVVREKPSVGDVVILVGGKTGRDGCGGATGSSKSHSSASLENCGAEVQKGNAPEERKLQRLFRNPSATRLIKRCNDFGAGGVSVAIGELSDSLEIDLNAVPKKYEGLTGTELAISESQERMAVVVSEKNASQFIQLAEDENLEATIVARVTDNARLVIKWNGKEIVNLSRKFLNTNGAEKRFGVVVKKSTSYQKPCAKNFTSEFKKLLSDLNVCSKRGLQERFDSTIGCGTVLMPLGGKFQRSPIQAMVNKITTEKGDAKTASVMSYGYNPFIAEKNQYHGAYLAVVESVCKLVASGASFSDVYLSFQEYFEKLNENEKWGTVVSSLLGALDAQLDLGVAAIGGKDSMSGSFENLSVPPTLISFAITTSPVEKIVSGDFKKSAHNVLLVKPNHSEKDLPDCNSLKNVFAFIENLNARKKVCAMYTVGYGGIAECVYKMSIGNRIGFHFADEIALDELFSYNYGAFVLEVESDVDVDSLVKKSFIDKSENDFSVFVLGKTIADEKIIFGNEVLALEEADAVYESVLEEVYPVKCDESKSKVREITYTKNVMSKNVAYKNVAQMKAPPRVLIPVFPGTNCEYDSAKAFEMAGAACDIFVIKNTKPGDIEKSVSEFAKKMSESQIVFIPGGFSGGDEPDGSGKFITSFFRNEEIKNAVENLLEKRCGLMAGICNGFQALIKLGLLQYGKITDLEQASATLTFNRIARHQSKIVRVRVSSTASPWLSLCKVGEVYNVPISHGEGRFMASEHVINEMAESGRIITQYVDLCGKVSNDVQYNVNGSDCAIEGIVSPCGRVLGKMGHAERIGSGLYKNVPGVYDMKIFESGVRYFKVT